MEGCRLGPDNLVLVLHAGAVGALDAAVTVLSRTRTVFGCAQKKPGKVREVLHGKGRRMVQKRRHRVVSMNRNRARKVAAMADSCDQICRPGGSNRRGGG